MERILIIDNDEGLLDHIEGYLPSEGNEVEVVCDDFELIERRLFLNKTGVDIDLVVISLEPYKASGFDLLRRLRSITAIPVIALIDGGSDVDRIVSLEIGADDCLSKPFNPRELLARVRSVMRRSNPDMLNDMNIAIGNGFKKLQVNDVEMDIGARTVIRSGEMIDLTSTEFGLLECFLKKPGELISRELLNEKVLSRPLTPYDRSIDVHVSKLRKKLGSSIEGCERIRAIRGEGYLYSIIDADFA
jgi:DNA-binding response OmpR family regulator